MSSLLLAMVALVSSSQQILELPQSLRAVSGGGQIRSPGDPSRLRQG
jgi:hypothetical protein